MEKTTALFNRYLLTQFDLDSGALTALGVVIHNFPKPGVYQGTMLRGKESISNFVLKVDENCVQMQVDIDLANVTSATPDPCCDEAANRTFVVNPKGYAVFHVSGGPGGFSVLLGPSDTQTPELLFDSRKLQEGDHFAATVLRPGSYSVNNALSKGESRAELVVAYPQPGRSRYEQPPVQIVTVTAKGFEPKRIQVAAGQSHVYDIKTPARIHIKLEKPYDGPSGPKRKYPSWTQASVEQKPDQQKEKPPSSGRKTSAT